MTSVSEEKSSAFSNSMRLLALNVLSALVVFGVGGINKLPTWRIIVFILVFSLLYRTSDYVREAFGIKKAEEKQ